MVPSYIKLSQEKITNNSLEVEGIELKERTIIVHPKVRKVLFSMLDGFKKQPSNATAMPKKPVELPLADIKTAKKKIKSLMKENFEGELLILNLLEFISNFNETRTPSCYIDILYETIKNTPIVGILQSKSRVFMAAMKSYLDGSIDIFKDKDVLDHLNDEVPLLVAMMSAVVKYEKDNCLPGPVKDVFNYMLKLLSQVHKLASERYMMPEPYKDDEPFTEYFPSLPLHSEKMKFKVDTAGFKDNESVDDDCNKEYPRAPKMTPGLAHIFCRHGICKGFVSMTSAESPQIFTNILTRRLPKTVQSERRIFLYDNSCNMHKHALRRGAKEILKFNLFTDRHHWKNHIGCSESYNCDKYDYLKKVNSQICEQKNRSLRKLSSTLAYCGFVNYMTKVKLFFMISNYEEKGFFK